MATKDPSAKVLGRTSKGTTAGLDFHTNGVATGHSHAHQAPVPLGRSYSDTGLATDSKPRAEVVGGKVDRRVIKESSTTHIL